MHFLYYFLLHFLCTFFITPTVFTWLRKIPQKLTNRRYFRPVWLWTYANKWGNRELPDVPQMAPRSWGNYYKAAHGLITGAFAESESDRFLYNYLNYYVFSKVCWDVTLDVEALLA